MLVRPNEAETALHGCHFLGDMAVRMRKVLARPWVGVRVRHLLFIVFVALGENITFLKVLCQAVLENLGNFSKQPNGLQTNCRNV